MKAKRMPSTDLDTIIPLLIGVWRRFYKLGGPPDTLQTREFRSVVSAVEKLYKGLETGKDLAGQDYFSEPDLLTSYLLYQWVIHYQQGLALINELPQTPKRVLDLCSGPGAFSFAALRQGATEVIAIDRNVTALQLAGEVCGRYGFPLTVRRHDVKDTRLPVEGSFDLIILGYGLEELFPDTQKGWLEAQEVWVQKIIRYLSPQGHILFVESSLLPANRRLLALRDLLVKAGIPVQAPCVWKGDCPSLQTPNSPCYAQRELDKPRLIKEIQRAAQINLSSLKMTYLIMREPQSGWPSLPEHPLYRVISPPFEMNTGKRYYLCGTDGKKDLGSQAPEQQPEARAFDFLKRGELIAVENALVKHTHFDIVLGTRIKIEAALNKPLPTIDEEQEEF
jgi:SAM-dependent methyltransferase